MFTKQHSIYGRQLAMSTTGGVVSAVTSTGGKNSTAFDLAAQMWGPAMSEDVDSSAFTVNSAGISVITTAVISASILTLPAPVQGVSKELHFQTEATAMTIAMAAGVTVNTTLAESAAGGTTALTVAGAAGGIGGVTVLRGLSSTVWGVVSHTNSLSS